MSRRIRVANCPYCGKLTDLDRKSPQPKHEAPLSGVTTCRSCYFVFENNRVESWLMDGTRCGAVKTKNEIAGVNHEHRSGAQ